ncbi:hypothetical protein [Nocardia salmonicida]|uniref:hypothetical protein n=1 Tax=Nocardia salmonicida TaxID=53431 RepID=UPI0037B45EE3
MKPGVLRSSRLSHGKSHTAQQSPMLFEMALKDSASGVASAMSGDVECMVVANDGLQRWLSAIEVCR